jgi:hypothetical protein
MDKTLQLIQHLYDERDGLDLDDALQQEYDELNAVKGVLDRREPASPNPEVVDRVVTAAGRATARGSQSEPERRREERPARARDTQTDTRILRRAGATLALVLIAALGWWQWSEPTSSSTPPAVSESAPQSFDAAAPESESARRSAGTVRSVSDLPDWDEGDDVVRLHQRIEILNARSTASQWGSSALLQTTGQPRP